MYTSFSNSSDGSCGVRYLVVSLYFSMVSDHEENCFMYLAKVYIGTGFEPRPDISF